MTPYDLDDGPGPIAQPDPTFALRKGDTLRIGSAVVVITDVDRHGGIIVTVKEAGTIEDAP